MEDMNLTNSNVNSENSVEMAPVTPAAPVVGFQAVDAEGNVVGFISKADLVNEAKQALYADLAFMEQNRPMTLPANTEQLAATAAAATDVYEDQLAIKSDAPFIRGLDAAGNPIRISKADLATVVGGLLYDTGDYPFQARTFSSDFNNAQDSGMYILADVKSYKNSPGFSYGLMVVFASYYILQMCIDSFATNIKVRINIDGNWSAWKSISL